MGEVSNKLWYGRGHGDPEADRYVEAESIRKLDRWVREGRYPNRSQAVQAALEVLARRNRLSTLDEALDAYRRCMPPRSRALRLRLWRSNASSTRIDPWPTS